jgi:hypothetical protein
MSESSANQAPGAKPVPKVFLSYAGEDAGWKTNFAQRDWFGDRLGNVHVVDYKRDGTQFGSIEEWTEKQIAGSSAFIALVSGDYIRKPIPQLEWRLALRLAETCVFVPVLLDVEAKAWWKSEAASNRLETLSRDYAWSDFTDGTGGRRPIVVKGLADDELTHKISELARMVKERIGRTTRIQTSQPKGATVVVLGHPTSSVSEVAKESGDLASRLKSKGVTVVRWPDRWRRSISSPAPADELVSASATFVQPAAPLEAGDFANDGQQRDKIKTALRLPPDSNAAFDACRVLIWLPQGLEDPDFKARLADGKPTGRVELNNQSVDELAAALAGKGAGARPEVPLLTLEAILDNENRKLRKSLYKSFTEVVSKVVDPKPLSTTFEGSVLHDQIEGMETDRAIIAIHDLNTGVSNAALKERLETKLVSVFDSVQVTLANANAKRRAANKPELRVFLSALVVNCARAIPYVKYPTPSRFDPWCLLPFVNGDTDPAKVHPKHGYQQIFCSYLQDWCEEEEVTA